MGVCASHPRVLEGDVPVKYDEPFPLEHIKRVSTSSSSSEEFAAHADHKAAAATAAPRALARDSPAEDGAGAQQHDKLPAPSSFPSPRPGSVIKADDIVARPYDPWMNGPPLPPCNSARLAAMKAIGGIDGPPDPNVEHIITLLCQVFQVEAALLALFEDSRIFVRNAAGFERGDFPWRWSFCAWSMLPPEPEVLLIEDAHHDARFADNQVAKSLGVRFYCGAPLIGSQGQRYGTLCFVDNKPRDFPAQQLRILANLAELVVREVERTVADHARKSNTSMFIRRALECFESGVAFIDTSVPGWRLLHCSTSFTRATGISGPEAAGKSLWELLLPPNSSRPNTVAKWAAACDLVAARRNEFVLKDMSVAGSPQRGVFNLRFRPAGKDALDEDTPAVGIPAQVPSDPAAGDHYYFAILLPASNDLRADSAYNSASPSFRTSSSQSVPTRASSLSVDSHPGSPKAQVTSAIQEARSSSGSLAARRGMMPGGVPFDGLELGPLVGEGSFGRVYRGVWNGKLVAVKVCAPSLQRQQPKDGRAGRRGGAKPWASAEALISDKFRHPHIVQAYRHCTVMDEEGATERAMSTVGSTDGSATPRSPAAAPSTAYGTASTNAGYTSASGNASPRTASRRSSLDSSRRPSNAEHPEESQLAEGGTASARGPSRLSPFAAASQVPPQLVANSVSGTSSFPSPFAAGRAVVAAGRGASSHSSPAQSPRQMPLVGTAAAIAAKKAAFAQASMGACSRQGSADGSADSLPELASLSHSTVAATSRSSSGRCNSIPKDVPRVPSIPEHAAVTLQAGNAGNAAASAISTASPIRPQDEGGVCEALHSSVTLSFLARQSEAAAAAAAAAIADDSRDQQPAPAAAAAGPGEPSIEQLLEGFQDSPRPPSPPPFAAAGLVGSGAPACIPTAAAPPSAETEPSAEHLLSSFHDGAAIAAARGAGAQQGGLASRSCFAGDSAEGTIHQQQRPRLATRSVSGNLSRRSTGAGSLATSSTSGGVGEVVTYLLLEYCDKGSLQNAIDKGWFRRPRRTSTGKPCLPVILSVAADIASAMAYLHGQDVLHGDLAGGNVLLTSCDDRPTGFCAKVADFGLSRQVSLQQRIVSTDSYGTVTHMPPELLSGGRLSAATDVFSFGVLMWEMFCGTRAWAGMSTAQVSAAVVIHDRRPEFPEDCPMDYMMLANMCMVRNPDQRPSFKEIESAVAGMRHTHPLTQELADLE